MGQALKVTPGPQALALLPVCHILPPPGSCLTETQPSGRGLNCKPNTLAYAVFKVLGYSNTKSKHSPDRAGGAEWWVKCAPEFDPQHHINQA